VKLWLVNPFDPLPGDDEQEGRYASLARALVAGGHEVLWWTSEFSHRFKKPVDRQAVRRKCQQAGVDVRFLPAPAYRGNVSPARLRNHRALAEGFASAAPGEAGRPDLVLASAPPPRLAREAVRFAARTGASSVVDVQDLWPETFRRLAPRPLRPLADLFLAPLAAASRDAYTGADAIVGVADAYVDRAVQLGGLKERTATFPLGVDLAAFDSAAARGRCERFTKPDGETWLIYSGSLSRSYDVPTVVRAFGLVRKRRGGLKLFVTGRGERAGRIDAIVRAGGLTDVIRPGFIDFAAWAYLLSQCDAGFNASFPEALIFLPNKVFWYFAAGLCVLNTIPGQCSRIVAEGGCGLDYRAGDVASCADAIERACDAATLPAMKAASRRLAEGEYDRAVVMPRYVRFLEGAAGS
jgi:glycosyltransferase involved in cell wall biosynthesis